jgi:two-component system, OmpR family, sensor histidine kinase VicK
MNTLLRFISKSKTINSCGDSRAPSFVFEIKEYRKLLTKLKKGNVKIRYITDINKDNLTYCKELLKFYTEIRHLEGMKANFSISETEYMASSSVIQGEEVQQQSSGPIQQVIYSNVKDIVEQQKYVFESFWNRSILAEQRINELEKGTVLGHTEVIQIPTKSKELLIRLLQSSKKQILLLLPTVNAFLREERLGIIDYLKDAAKKRSINVKIITPVNDKINEIIQNIKSDNINNFFIQPFEMPFAEINVNTVTILVVDRKESLVIEKKDDSKNDFVEAVGLSTYSTSNPTVLSYVSVFENLINQIKLYERLKVHGKMQEEFINVASHELRTPTQAILTCSDLLQNHPKERNEMIDVIKRNATRLQRLTEDILDVTKIESKTLNLHKEKFNLTVLLSNTIGDYKKDGNGEDKIRLLYTNINKEPLFVEADYARIIQVLSNILNNAIKFTKEGKRGGDVYITTEKKKVDDDDQQVTVSVRDTSSGIDNGIFPRLFTKFATKSTKGTGLGLFICKGIIEAHGGKIWAKNNEDGEKGATFAFSLPLISNRHLNDHSEIS